MNRPVLFHDAAEKELDAAFEWYRMRSARATRRFLDEIDEAIEGIRQSPQQFPQIATIARRALLHRFPFAVVFREREAGIQVLAVAHTSRRPYYWRTR